METQKEPYGRQNSGLKDVHLLIPGNLSPYVAKGNSSFRWN